MPCNGRADHHASQRRVIAFTAKAPGDGDQSPLEELRYIVPAIYLMEFVSKALTFLPVLLAVLHVFWGAVSNAQLYRVI